MIKIVTGDAARQSAGSMPVNVLMYSHPGLGKSTDAVAAFCRDGRCTAFVIQCEDNAIKAPISRGLPIPDHTEETVKSWQAMCETFAWLWERRNQYSGVIIDGFSAFSTHLYQEAQQQLKGAKNKYDVPVQVRNQLFTLRSGLRNLGLHSVLLAHPVQPAVQEGVFYPGGFSLNPKSMISEYFSQTDTVLRVDYVAPPPPAIPNGVPPVPTRVYFTGGTAWPEAFAQPPDWRLWRTKNREGCNAAIVAADLGAFLRARQPPYGGL